MTRPAVSSRQFGLLAAGGSFLLLIASSVAAEAPATADKAPGATATAAPAAPAGLARINIAPLRLELDSKTNAATVMLTNTSERPVPVQTRLFA